MSAPLLEDSRIAQITAMLDDSRTLVADLLDEIPASEWPIRHYLSEARYQLNVALISLGKIQ